MARIVGGAARGRRLVIPPGREVRPTSDRVREALFSSLEADLGGLGGVAFLDLYAGSGAVGLEAASRGAEPVRLVESDRRAAGAIRTNLRTVRADAARLVSKPVERMAALAADVAFEVVFADPPYALDAGALAEHLRRLQERGWLAREALVVVERSTREGTFGWPGGIVADRSRRYGDTTLWYGRATERAVTREDS